MQQTKFKELPLSPYQIVRLSDGPIFFGLGPTQLAEKIKLGEIPEPKYLTSMGRARGWTGEQIIDWHRANDAAQAERAAAAEKYQATKPKPGQRKDGKPVRRHRAKAGRSKVTS